VRDLSPLPLLAALMSACGADPAPAPPPAGAHAHAQAAAGGPEVVALLTIDTWRLDHFSADRTPNLWRLASEGRRYTNAWSPVGLTSPAHASMLSGMPPWEHGLRANNHHGYRLADGVPWFPKRFEGPTAAFVSAYPAGPAGGLDRGFDVFSAPESGERPGEIAVQEALSWLPDQGPAFLWVHVYEPHGPYVGDAVDDPGRYAQEVARADALLAPLVQRLRARGARIVVAADHGEVLLEETCGRQHERSTSAHVLHVPLFSWEPGGDPAVVDDLVGLTDVPGLLAGQRPAAHDAWLAESGMCEPSCAPGCSPAGLAGRDRVVIDAGGRFVERPGRGRWSEGRPDAAHEVLLDTIPAVPAPEGGAPEEAEALGYVDPGR